MAEMPDISQRPLLTFLENIQTWIAAARLRDFWQDMIEHRTWADQLRDEAKGIIIWLELKGQDDAASRLDETMREAREAIWVLKETCEGVYPLYLRDLVEITRGYEDPSNVINFRTINVREDPYDCDNHSTDTMMPPQATACN